MKPISVGWFVGCAIAAATSLCAAGQTHYECVVLTASKLNAQGALEAHWSVKSQIGQKFRIDRSTGKIVGGPLDNSKMKTQLIDRGSGEMSFQVFAQSTQKTHTSYIQVEEFQSTEQKPFMGTTTLYYPGVYTGTCK